MRNNRSVVTISLLLAVSMVFAFAGPSYAEEKGFYFGIGANYAHPTGMDISGEGDDFEYFGPKDTDYKGAAGLNVKAGYHIKSFFALEFDFDKYADFKWEDDVLVYDPYVYHTINPIDGNPDTYAKIEYEGKTSITSYMLSGKLSSDVFESFKPFIVAGAGFMMVENEASGDLVFPNKNYNNSFSEKDKGTVFCGKLGAGVDYNVTESVSVGFEASYIMAQDLKLKKLNDEMVRGDSDAVLEIELINLNLGAKYYF